jgi:glyoxylase-like metal-dependent hydrolase (beta-lactamase superfamily II)
LRRKKMIFTLEALEAKHGDSLLLHYGEKAAPKLIVIDGGPKGVYNKTLRPRLEQIKGKRSPDKPLPIRMVMISHIDDDHIKGILDLTDKLIEQGEVPFCKITTLWHNSFDDILGNEEVKALSAALAKDVKLSAAGELTFPPGMFTDEGPAAIAANVPQGRNLRNNAEKLVILTNRPFKKLVRQLKDNPEPVDIDGMLKMTVLGPSDTRLGNLQADWNKKLPGILAKEAASAASLMDESIYNLSSIVVLVEAGGKKLLLTGDGLADDILAGLKEAGALDNNGKLHVDLFKMPHHGSIRNISKELLERVTADHYVMSASGKYDNPDVPTLELLSEVRGADKYTVHLTNAVPHAINFYDQDMQKAGKNYELNVRKDPDLSLRVHFGEPFED